MKKIRLVIVSLVLVAVSAFSIFAQTQQTAPSKIGFINTMSFGDAKAGITKYSSAMNSVDIAFKGEMDALKAMVARIQTLETELANLQKQASAPGQNNAALVNTYNTKLEEYDKLGREYKFKQEDARTRYQRRRQEVMGPVLVDIGKAMQEFARQRGYAMIFDASKLDEGGVLLTVDEKADVTRDFIAFYNARPATAATTAPVK